MTSLVLFTTLAPAPLTDELTSAGYRVFKALAVSEVLHICETESIDIVVIDANVDEQRGKDIQCHHTTLRLERGATAKNLVWELTQLFPEKIVMIQ